MNNPSFNPKLKEYMNTLSEISAFFSEYSVRLARKQSGQYDEKIEDIEVHLNNASEGIAHVVALEMLENEYFNHEPKTEKE